MKNKSKIRVTEHGKEWHNMNPVVCPECGDIYCSNWVRPERRLERIRGEFTIENEEQFLYKCGTCGCRFKEVKTLDRVFDIEWGLLLAGLVIGLTVGMFIGLILWLVI